MVIDLEIINEFELIENPRNLGNRISESNFKIDRQVSKAVSWLK